MIISGISLTESSDILEYLNHLVLPDRYIIEEKIFSRFLWFNDK